MTSLSMLFSNNVKSYTQGENKSLNQNLYSFLENVCNRKDVNGKATELNHGS